eukprot:13408163-Heterocapsa_arctica.AAC.1
MPVQSALKDCCDRTELDCLRSQRPLIMQAPGFERLLQTHRARVLVEPTTVNNASAGEEGSNLCMSPCPGNGSIVQAPDRVATAVVENSSLFTHKAWSDGTLSM